MDESKDKDVDVSSVSDSGAGETLTKTEPEPEPVPMVCEERSACEGEAVVEEGGSLHGEDIMVEVLGSDVFVDGVCTSSGDGIGENADHGEDAGCGGVGELDEVVQEKEVKSLEGVNQEVESSAGDATKTERVELCGQPCVSEEVVAKESEKGAKRGVEDSTVEDIAGGEVCALVTEEATEVREEELVKKDADRYVSKKDVVLGDEVQNAVVENNVESAGDSEDAGRGGGGELDEVVLEKEVKSLEGEKLVSQEVGDSVRKVSNCGTGSEGEELCGQRGVSDEVVVKDRGVENSSAVVDCTVGETRVVVTEEVTEVKEAELIEEDAERDESKEDAVLGDEGPTTVVENSIESSSAVEGSSGGETQLVVDKVSSTAVESVGYTTVAANNDLEKQEVGISDDVVIQNTKIETTVVEAVIIHTQGFQEATEIVEDKRLNHEVDVANANPDSLVVQTQPEAAIEEVEDMDTDAGDESSVDKQLANVEVGGGIITDPVLSCQPTEVVENEQPKLLPNSETDQQSKLDESLDEGLVNNPGQVKSSGAEEMEVDNQLADAEQIGVCVGGHEIVAERLDLKVETVSTGNEIETEVSDRMEGGIALNSNGETVRQSNEIDNQGLKSEECVERSVASDFAQLDSDVGQETEVKDQANVAEEVKEQPINGSNGNNVNDSADPDSLCQPAQLTVEGDVAAMDVDVVPNQNLEIQETVGLDGILPSSENDQDLKAETVRQSNEIDSQVNNREEMATTSNDAMNDNIESQGPGEKEDQQSKLECLNSCVDHDLSEVDSNMVQEMVAENHVTDAEHVLLEEEQETDFEEQVADNEDPNSIEQMSKNQAAQKHAITTQQARYQLPAESEDEFSVSDLVWGKVRSHPWWPGQIFDPSDSSEKAMKHHKKDCFLVAYFGDRTFAWNEASLLKPFQTHFSQIEKQSNSEAFQNAVDCALEEVSRRVELGLACSCIPNDACDSIKFQKIENTGIREESSMRAGVDKSASASSFEPDKLMEFIKALAQSPSVGADRLDLVIAKAQLLALCRYKGYSQLPEFCGALLESGTETSCPEPEEQVQLNNSDFENAGQRISEMQKSTSHKRKHNLRDMYPIKKEKCLSELMGGTLDFPDGQSEFDGKPTSKLVSPTAAKKRKTVDDTMIQDGTKNISLAKILNTSTSAKQSFKIGECIQRAATHLTGAPAIMKCNNDKTAGDGFGVSLEELEEAQGESMILPAECSSLDELLSQLHLAAQDPFQSSRFLNIIVGFFSDFRDSVVPSQSSVMEKCGGKRKMSSHSIAGFPETFEFVDMNDSYWTDMVVQNGSLEQLSRKSKREYQIVPVALEPDKSAQGSRRPYSRKRYRDANSEIAAAETKAYMDEKRRASPAEIIMTFPTVNSVPSETSLSKMFRRFGPLKESETEVDRETCRARVVYKKGSDAEVAYSSAGKFNIFGSVVVNYQLNFSPFEPFKALYTPTIEGLEESTLYLHPQS